MKNANKSLFLRIKKMQLQWPCNNGKNFLIKMFISFHFVRTGERREWQSCARWLRFCFSASGFSVSWIDQQQQKRIKETMRDCCAARAFHWPPFGHIVERQWFAGGFERRRSSNQCGNRKKTHLNSKIYSFRSLTDASQNRFNDEWKCVNIFHKNMWILTRMEFKFRRRTIKPVCACARIIYKKKYFSWLLKSCVKS